jgi:hypothetical protein
MAACEVFRQKLVFAETVEAAQNKEMIRTRLSSIIAFFFIVTSSFSKNSFPSQIYLEMPKLKELNEGFFNMFSFLVISVCLFSSAASWVVLSA